MKIKPGFELRTICRENLIVAHGRENINFTKIISLNESAAYVWKQVIDKDFTLDDMVKCLMDEYEVDEATAKKDCEALMQSWKDAELIDE